MGKPRRRAMTFSKTVLLLIALSILLFLTLVGTSCQNNQQETSTLQGTVSVGPLWPVERPGENPPVSPQVFESRKVIIYDESKTNMVKSVDLIQIDQSAKATYSTQLKPGKYVVDINHGGIDRSQQVPTNIEIRPGQIVVIDIDVDTGIR